MLIYRGEERQKSKRLYEGRREIGIKVNRKEKTYIMFTTKYSKLSRNWIIQLKCFSKKKITIESQVRRGPFCHFDARKDIEE